jgi:hypothetical protein
MTVRQRGTVCGEEYKLQQAKHEMHTAHLNADKMAERHRPIAGLRALLQEIQGWVAWLTRR